VRDGDDYVVNGTKMFITNATRADFIALVAKTDTAAGHSGISMFVAPTDLPGFSVSRKLDKIGNRVSDTAELVERVIERLDWSEPTCSWRLNREIGRALRAEGHMPSVLGCAEEAGVPVYVPAFTDSEMGLDVATHFMRRQAQRGTRDMAGLFAELPAYNPFLDLCDFAQRIAGAKRLGILTIGGGVPRNWAQQVGPFVDLMNTRLGMDFGVPRYRYAVRICPEPVHWGGLSGCTYSEGVSWGKFVSPQEGGRFAEVHCDATIAWPLLVRAVLEAQGKLSCNGAGKGA